MKELVSVCIPTYNDGDYLREMLNSVVNQTYENLDIVILDNASKDQTPEVVNSFKDRRIRYYRKKRTTPSCVNFNGAVRLAKGNYVALYHSDDVYTLDIIEKELKFLITNPDAGAVFALDVLINDNSEYIGSGVRFPKQLVNRQTYGYHDILIEMLKKNGSFLVWPTVMTRRIIFNTVGFFEEAEEKVGASGNAGDAEFCLRLARQYRIGVIKERLIKRRISISQDSTSNEATRLSRSNHFIVLESFLAFYKDSVPVSVLRQYKFNMFFDDLLIAKNLIKIGRHKEAYKRIYRSMKPEFLLTAFFSLHNFCIMTICAILIISAALDLPQLSSFLFKCINKLKPNVTC